MLAAVFWDSSDVLLWDFLEHRRTVNDDRYYTTLKSLRKAVK
jgi:hypothetical protein